MTDTKMVIVMRKDLNMRKGKMVAQGSHAAMAWLTQRIVNDRDLADQRHGGFGFVCCVGVNRVEDEWLASSFKKICVGVGSEEELVAIHQRALEARLQSHLITDRGDTEFHGVPTITCCAIGPDESAKIDVITGHLPLL